MLDVAFLVVVLRGGFGVAARLQAEDDGAVENRRPHFGEAVAGLDVVAVLVLPVKQGVGTVVVGFVRHLEGVGGAAVVAEIAVLVVQLEEVEQVVVETGFEVVDAVGLRLQPAGEAVEGVFYLLVEFSHADGVAEFFVQRAVFRVGGYGIPRRLGLRPKPFAAVGEPLPFVGVVRATNRRQLAPDNARQILLAVTADELVDEGVLEPQDLEQAEVQVVAVELEHLAQEVLELGEGGLDCGGCRHRYSLFWSAGSRPRFRAMRRSWRAPRRVRRRWPALYGWPAGLASRGS